MEVAPEIAVEITAYSLTGIIILFSLTLCGSKIPETMSKIKETAGKLLVRNAKYKLQYGLGNEAIYLLRRVEKNQIIHLSACGMVKIKKSYLLSAIGGLFTYGLLILNFKMRDFQEYYNQIQPQNQPQNVLCNTVLTSDGVVPQDDKEAADLLGSCPLLAPVEGFSASLYTAYVVSVDPKILDQELSGGEVALLLYKIVKEYLERKGVCNAEMIAFSAACGPANVKKVTIQDFIKKASVAVGSTLYNNGVMSCKNDVDLALISSGT
ncbi:hypothetical protein JTE90_008773 [Oedothorax gibbosus]|uniref:Uncharacterized protein n=1 Tax=Oedothorax gibbosus TaxID=931172 RepID=A0AAV6V6I6_9ARAC|nr:hypothetical protein JTE90_008773 [Oedothorax gibbosus]